MAGEIVTAAQIIAGSGAAGWFLDKLLGPSADALGDQLKVYASDRMSKIFRRAKDIADGRDIRPLAPGFALVAIQRASFSEDAPQITEMWAHLIADAATNQTNRHVLYAEILSQIGGEEALLLERFDYSQDEHFQLRQQYAVAAFQSQLQSSEIIYAYSTQEAATKIDQILSISNNIVGIISRVEMPTKENGDLFQISRRLVSALSLDIIERQRLVENIVVKSDHHVHSPKIFFSVLTELGADFLRVCRGVGE